MKVLIVSAGVPGHLNPMLSAANILVEAGHSVAVQTATELKEQIEKAGFAFIPESRNSTFIGRFLQEYPERQILEPGMEMTGFDLQYYFARNIPGQYESLSNALKEFPADIVLAESFYWGTLPLLMRPKEKRPVVAHLGITVLNLGSGTNFPVAESAEAQLQRQRLMLEPAQFAVNDEFSKLGLQPLPCPALESVSRMADVYLHPGIRSFEYPDSEGINLAVRYIGPLPVPASESTMPDWWGTLDASKKRVLVTQGTIANVDLGQLIGPALTALANEEDIEVLVTTGNQPIESIPVALPANAHVARFFPFDRIMPGIDLLITNGGYGTINTALEHGIPIVVAGLTEDKEEVAAHVAWSGVGIDLHTIQPEVAALRDAVRQVLDDASFRDNAEKLAMEFKEHSTARELVEHLEAAVDLHTFA